MRKQPCYAHLVTLTIKTHMTMQQETDQQAKSRIKQGYKPACCLQPVYPATQQAI